jgi:DMSO/TMAO reductase YedYZ molybdopterin-dependent catalytic subunit
LGAAGAAAWSATAARLEYLTPVPQARILGRGNPPPSQLPPEKLREVGLHPETWFLDVVPDPDSNASVERPLTIDWKGLMKLADRHAVRFLHVCICTNVADPFHMTVWEGVPLREAIWLTRPKANVRRAYYYGYHTPESQRFQSSLPLGRILEDPPGELPVILAYKMNGQEIPATHGGPVRMVVPGVYGNKSVKWLQRIVLTNEFRANDTYAEMNNDVESPMKTQARFINAPTEVEAGKPFALAGLAQVGMSGLAKIQYSVRPEEWADAAILPPPEDWGGGLPGGKLPPATIQIDPATGRPRAWPLRYTIVHWAALAPALAPGKYDLRCRTIDANGIAQPMPRPLPRTGLNAIHQVTLTVKNVIN